jgi:hypothetical protein
LMSGSLLGQLRARREELVAAQTETITVPGWTNPAMRLRIEPVAHPVISRIQERAKNAPHRLKGEAELNANAAVVATAVTSVLIGDGEDRAEVDLNTPDFLASFDLDESPQGADVIRAICLRDGDVVTLALAVLEHSGYGQDAIEGAFAGE